MFRAVAVSLVVSVCLASTDAGAVDKPSPEQIERYKAAAVEAAAEEIERLEGLVKDARERERAITERTKDQQERAAKLKAEREKTIGYRKRILALRKKEATALPPLYRVIDEVIRAGDVGTLADGYSVKAIQIDGPQSMRVQCSIFVPLWISKDGRQAFGGGKTNGGEFLISGFPTGTFQDGASLSSDTAPGWDEAVFLVKGTESYTTVLGASRTLWRLEVVPPETLAEWLAEPDSE